MRGRPFIITGSVVLLAGGALLAVSSHRRGSPTTAPVIAPNEARAPAAETKPMPPRVPQRPAPAVGPSDPAAAEPAPSPQSPGSYDTYAAVNATPDERRRLD